jgi:hypothetical protein
MPLRLDEIDEVKEIARQIVREEINKIVPVAKPVIPEPAPEKVEAEAPVKKGKK